MADNKIFVKNKYGVTGLVFKMDATDGKKWVRFVAMQQKNTTLIYDLNTMKGTVESYLNYVQKNCTAIQRSTVPSLKNRTKLYKSQETTNKQGHERVMNLLKF